MGKYISFGEYNNLYKYIWYYIIVCSFNDYIFADTFPKQIKFSIFETKNYPPDIFIQQEFNYFGSFLLSILIYLYEEKQLFLKYLSKILYYIKNNYLFWK